MPYTEVWKATFMPESREPTLSEIEKISSPVKAPNPMDRPRNVPKIPRPVSIPETPELKKLMPVLSRRSSLIYSPRSQDDAAPRLVLVAFTRRRYLSNASCKTSSSKTFVLSLYFAQRFFPSASLYSFCNRNITSSSS